MAEESRETIRQEVFDHPVGRPLPLLPSSASSASRRDSSAGPQESSNRPQASPRFGRVTLLPFLVSRVAGSGGTDASGPPGTAPPPCQSSRREEDGHVSTSLVGLCGGLSPPGRAGGTRPTSRPAFPRWFTSCDGPPGLPGRGHAQVPRQLQPRLQPRVLYARLQPRVRYARLQPRALLRPPLQHGIRPRLLPSVLRASLARRRNEQD